MREKRNYRVFLTVDNFQTDCDELKFDDFSIKSIKPGFEAAEWRRRMHCKNVPEYILVRDFKDYSPREDDLSGFDHIMSTVMNNILLAFRLFKPGDIFFNDMMIDDLDSEEGSFSFSLYRMDNISAHKYVLNKEHTNQFIEFKNTIIPKIELMNKYLNYSIGQFLQGGNKSFFYRKEAISRIVDYVVALESLFLVDSNHLFLRRTLANRVSVFLTNPDRSAVVKFMYDERSNIVHGNHIDIDESKEKKLVEKLNKYMIPFELLMREVFVKMLDIQFNTRKDLEEYMISLFKLPAQVVTIMNNAKSESEKLLIATEKEQYRQSNVAGVDRVRAKWRRTLLCCKIDLCMLCRRSYSACRYRYSQRRRRPHARPESVHWVRVGRSRSDEQ